MDLKSLSKLPSPFYRVTVKALIQDNEGRILVGRGEEDSEGWEMPGGGWEHDESLIQCLKRELTEELGVTVASVGDPVFLYRGRSTHGWMILRIAAPVKLRDYNFKFGEMKEAKFVGQDEFMSLDFAADEGTIKGQADKIWQA